MYLTNKDAIIDKETAIMDKTFDTMTFEEISAICKADETPKYQEPCWLRPEPCVPRPEPCVLREEPCRPVPRPCVPLNEPCNRLRASANSYSGANFYRCPHSNPSPEKTSAEIALDKINELRKIAIKYVRAVKLIWDKKIPKPPKTSSMLRTRANWALMTWYWFYEELDDTQNFGKNTPESYDIAHSYAMREVIKEYYRTGKIPKEWGFTGAGTATWEYGSVEWFIGSFEIQNFKLQNGIATFTVYNESTWKSATRLPQSWQDYIKELTGFEIHELVTSARRGQVIRTKLIQVFPGIEPYLPRDMRSIGGDWEQNYEIEMKWSLKDEDDK